MAAGGRVSSGYAVFPGVVGGSSQVFLAGPYMILYGVDLDRPAALLRDLRPSPGDLARRGPEINSTPLASPPPERSTLPPIRSRQQNLETAIYNWGSHPQNPQAWISV